MKTCKKFFAALALAFLAFQPLFSQERELHIVTTGDVHGSWFDRPYVDGGASKTSLMSVKVYVDSLRSAVGADNVLLLDAGDCLQGDNAAYYYNYVRTDVPHLFPRIVKYMGYDAVTVGNHDVETAHPVYDRVYSELTQAGIPLLGGNALRVCDGKPYFPVYKLFERGGMKVAVLGFTNPNMKAWLSEPVWRGIEFVSLIPFVQQCVDEVREECRPDAVVVVVHSGTGEGNGESLESQGLDLLASLKGADLIVTSHDHRPFVAEIGSCVLVNGGARAGNVTHSVIALSGSKGKSVHGQTVRMDKRKVSEEMGREFASEFEEVKEFTNRKVGHLAMEMRTRDAYSGMSDYINLVHTVQISVPEAQISFAAPLTFDGTVKQGDLIYNDMFTIYPYENQLFVLRLKGSEIKNYLEASYDSWIVTSGKHVLNIREGADARTGTSRWAFVNRSYNFDSASGLVYTVDVTKKRGSRVKIASLADGTPFELDAFYNVSMTSYRANGGGGLLAAAGLSKEDADSRVVARYPEIRDMVYEFVRSHAEVTSELVGDPALIGEWHFVPEKKVAPLMKADLGLIF